ncbi:MAG: MucR family transcriptional regulator [Rhodospirillaceae bacterium]|jgi:predicted transcriptional regulator|nr:MucR family transcriptional regulator [Rhodospirillaceae bacterium]MBT4686460.1 MucR family transcriptional regulator [Rhodospirillaceae bacterium]MBT5080115.1 MucR family transcriptional regulator [Rhodospirillaceae bacterium]MBT5526429.1 MucR family transcriptional regulator [Rhodospirillaceae bacterium]MBT5877961.1 MucR family transcriptional regulator [Rhodospirillaceae bacterium]
MNKQNNNIPKDELRRISVDIVSAYVGYNTISKSELPSLIKLVHGAFTNLGSDSNEEIVEQARKPAVPIRRSVQQDYIICLEDGRELKMLKRYLRTRYNMTPDEYRRKWGLPADYPMVAPSYSSLRSNHAKEIGLGRVRRGPAGGTDTK